MSKLIRKTDLGLLKFKDVTAVTSKVVADALGVKHSNLMRNVKKAEKYLKSHSSEYFNPIFKKAQCLDGRGGIIKCYVMSFDAVLTLSFIMKTEVSFALYIHLLGIKNNPDFIPNDDDVKTIVKHLKTEIKNARFRYSLVEKLNDNTIGIYMLIKKEEVVYIGQSKNIKKRIPNHYDKDFDAIAFAECPKDFLDEIEETMIKRYKPILNIVFITRIVARIPIGFTAEEIRNDVLDLARKLKGVH